MRCGTSGHQPLVGPYPPALIIGGSVGNLKTSLDDEGAPIISLRPGTVLDVGSDVVEYEPEVRGDVPVQPAVKLLSLPPLMSTSTK